MTNDINYTGTKRKLLVKNMTTNYTQINKLLFFSRLLPTLVFRFIILIQFQKEIF